MTKRWIILGALIPSLLLAGCTAGTATPGGSPQPCSVTCASSDQTAPRTLAVTGEGKVTVAPDIAFIFMSVVTRDANLSTAWDANNATTQAVITALQAQGIKPEDMQSNLNVSQQEKFDATGQPTGVITYIVTNTLTVTDRELGKIGQVLGAAQAAGVNSIAGITFGLEDPTSAVSQARALALADARSRAEEIAKGLGITIVRILSVSENPAYVPLPVEKGYGAFGMGGGSSVPIQVGTTQVSMTIYVTFEIQ